MEAPQSHARAFLKLLDDTTDAFCIRTLPDKADLPARLRKNFNGSLEQVYSQLQSRNHQGAGIFVAINEGGHKKDDINRVRAVFADTDGADVGPIIAALPPHIVVNSSPGKWHVYWRVADGFPLDQFGPVQRAIAEKFGTDTSVTDLSRVMRLPGFNHNKAEPYPVTIIDWDLGPPRYRFDEITQGLHLNLSAQPTLSNPPSSYKSAVWRKVLSGQFTKMEIEEMLRFIDPDCGRKEWMDVFFVLAFELGEEGRELTDRWSRGDLWNGEA